MKQAIKEVVEKTETCKRCGYEWKPRTAGKPVACPACKSYKWDEERF